MPAGFGQPGEDRSHLHQDIMDNIGADKLIGASEAFNRRGAGLDLPFEPVIADIFFGNLHRIRIVINGNGIPGPKQHRRHGQDAGAGADVKRRCCWFASQAYPDQIQRHPG